MPAKKQNEELQHIIKVVDKLDLAIDKLSDVSSDIRKILYRITPHVCLFLVKYCCETCDAAN